MGLDSTVMSVAMKLAYNLAKIPFVTIVVASSFTLKLAWKIFGGR